MISRRDGHAGSKPGVFKRIIDDAAEAKCFVEIQACLTGEIASVSFEYFVGVGPADGAIEEIAVNALGARAIISEGSACHRDIDAGSLVEILLAIAGLVRNTGVIHEVVPLTAVDAGAIAGIVPITSRTHLHAHV